MFRVVTGNGYASRYDPKATNLIADINDLVEDSSDTDSDDDAIIGSHSSMQVAGSERMNGRSRRSDRQQKKKQRKYGPGGAGSSLFCRQIIVILTLIGIIVAASLAIGYAVINGDPSKLPHFTASDDGVPDQQQLLEIAERVVTACSENELNEDRSECQQLCHSKLCCFESGEYSCEEDESKDCAVYAGCEALVEGIPLEAAEEDEE